MLYLALFRVSTIRSGVKNSLRGCSRSIPKIEENLMYVLIVFFVTVSGNGCFGKACPGVAMQEFSSAETCEAAKKTVERWSNQLKAECLKK